MLRPSRRPDRRRSTTVENPHTRPRDAAGGRLVLVCDDDANLRELVRAVLGPQYRFVEAADGTEALAVAREFAPDLIVLDVMLPGRSGLEVLEELRGDDDLGGVPVVVITAWDHAEADAWSAGADRVFLKPFEPDALSGAVVELLE